MSSFRLAVQLLKNNFKIYSFYLAILVVTVSTYYNFAAIQHHKEFVHLTEQLQSASVASVSSGFILLCTVVFFMGHANAFFFKQRQKETGLYMLLGISTSKIGWVYAIESLILGSLSLVIGLSAGILFSKLFFMLLSKAMFLDVQLPFSISGKAVIQVVLLFTMIFLILGISNYRKVKKSQLLDMLNAAQKKQKAPRFSLIKGLTGILFILTGYVIAISFKQWNMDLLLATLAILLLICFGTYLFFGSFLALVFNWLIKSKKILYGGVRLVSINSVFFRLAANYRSLAITAILAAATVTSLGVSLSLHKLAKDHAFIEAPYDISYKTEGANAKVKEAIQQSGKEIISENSIMFSEAAIHYKSGKKVDLNQTAIVARFSEVEDTLNLLKLPDKRKVLSKIKPNKNEAVFILSPNTIATPIIVEGEAVSIEGKTFTVKESPQLPFTGNAFEYGKMNLYVLDDQQYESLFEHSTKVGLHGLTLKKLSQSNELESMLASELPGGTSDVHIYGKNYIWEHYALGTLFFLGTIMSLVFMLATFSTIYFKILSEAISDKEQYGMLKKIGMSRKETQQSIIQQVGLAFLLPIAIGIIHSLAAMNMLGEIMNAEFPVQLSVSVGIFLLSMSIFYAAICRSYIRMVYDK